MQVVARNVAVVMISASEAAEAVRRELTTRGLEPAAATASLASLRRALVRQPSGRPTVLCITLDDPTLRRHGRSLASLLDDRDSFATTLRSIGLLVDGKFAARWAEVGCDAWAADVNEVERLIDGFAAQHAIGHSSPLLLRRVTTLPFPTRADTRALDLR